MLSAEHPSRIPAENLFNFLHCSNIRGDNVSLSLSLFYPVSRNEQRCSHLLLPLRGERPSAILAIIFAKQRKEEEEEERKGTKKEERGGREEGETVLSREERSPLPSSLRYVPALASSPLLDRSIISSVTIKEPTLVLDRYYYLNGNA